ncbi:MAG TPA: hybrid sensor histidine kinase/response regulator [Steroidobacteraceae bacterium]|nr:hybrid sensor histidine kinase/response regulator [Steroidobacteraceae bacterium]
MQARIRDSLVGPRLWGEPAWLRYGLAIALLACTAFARAELTPLIGRHSPLLPFVLPVLLTCYLSGRGPAWLIAVASPVLCTLQFQADFRWSDSVGWLAHVTFFVLVCAALIEILHRLQVTHRKLLDSEALLLEADRRKNQFLAMLAHELRNPLAPILNIAPILRSRAYEPSTVQQMSGVLQRQASHLARLVDDLLDVARITRDKIELHWQNLIAQDVIERALETARPMIGARRQSVDVDVPTQPLKLDGDVVRLTQAIGNLLTNASKFSPDGARIHVTAAQLDGKVQIRVRDEGAGIDAQILPQVFDLFVQGDQSLDRAQGGLGIGLTVTKRLVELHGGRIEVASAGAGRGCEFTITLPQGVLDERASDLPAAAPAASRRILVVDDNADAATSLAVLLEMEGHEVVTVRDGLAAMRELDRFDAQLVLTDIGLPGIDGYALADLIRQRGGEKPHLVALSGYAVEAQDPEGGAVFDAYLTKPLDLARLAEVLARLPEVQRGVVSR